jgi:CHAT domain-containing protein/tetratricopeptide (TPR) repeat protein
MRFAFRGARGKSLLAACAMFGAVISQCATHLRAQSPFQFREAYLLERRMAPNRGGMTDLTHFDENMSRITPTAVQNGDCQIHGCLDPDGKTVFDLDNLFMYQTGRWIGMLEETDKDRGAGAFAVAGPKYGRMIELLKKAQGEYSSPVALMLDHLGEYYLEDRDYEQAYKTFLEAVEIRRIMIKSIPPAPPEGVPDPDLQRRAEARLHLADMLTRLGQMDLAKGDVTSAQKRLDESAAISNERISRRFVGSLYAIYFDSLALERQGKWSDAESLWQQAVKAREGIELSTPYWDCLKEMAAFYARRGDFHTAAQVAQKVMDGSQGKQWRQSLPMPYQIDSRPRGEDPNGAYSLYLHESEVALKEMLAMDKWQTDGPAAAAGLLPDLVDGHSRYTLDEGSDSERAQLLAWYERRVFLHMSILLDGQPSQSQVDKAYAELSEIKGRYLASMGETTRIVEDGRNNPGVDTDAIPILDQLSEARDAQAKLYLDSALDGKPFQAAEFGAVENVQRILSTMLSADPSNEYHSGFSVQSVARAVPADTAFLDFVLWDRIDRNSAVASHREYGVFVVRQGQPVRYVRLGPADAIDADIDGLKAGVLGGRTRGFLVEGETKPVSAEAVEQKLRGMYAKVIAPLQGSLEGASQLLIVPDGKLTLAPMSAFIDGRGHALFESRTILYMNSWRDIYSTIAFRTDAATPPVVVANPDFNLVILPPPAAAGNLKRPVFPPLPGAELEAHDIEQALDVAPDRILIGGASRKWLIQSLESPGILHFATHTVPSLEWPAPTAGYSLFDVPQPYSGQNPLMQSFLAVAGASRPQNGPEDGILTGLEVSRLHLTGTRLVVLSTCQSGQGTPVEGLGVMGLRAAFSMAGAQSLVMTLWPVDDAAGRQFMQFFYAHLSQGPAAAVRLAQLDMVSKTQYKNPFYWSGYVVSGTPEIRPSGKAPVRTMTPARSETLITPRCFEMFFSHQDGDIKYFETVRLKIGGDVYRNLDSPEQATYDLSNPGNAITVRTTMTMKGGPRQMQEIKGEGRDRWTGTLTMQSHKDSSELELRFGRRTTETEKRQVVTLKGGPRLFPTLDIPSTLPAPAEFSAATDSYAEGFTLDRIAACTETPAW